MFPNKAVRLVLSTSMLLLFSVHCVNFSYFILLIRKLFGNVSVLLFLLQLPHGGN